MACLVHPDRKARAAVRDHRESRETLVQGVKGQGGSDGRDGAIGPAGPQGPQGEPGLSGGNNPATIEVVDGSISVGWDVDRPNDSLRYILRDPDGIDLDTFTESTDVLLFQSSHIGTEFVFGDIPDVEVFVSSADAVDGLSGAYATIEFEVTASLDDYVDWSLHISELWLPFRDAKGYAEFVALPIEFETETLSSVSVAADPLNYFM